jgi:hypothetical protein
MTRIAQEVHARKHAHADSLDRLLINPLEEKSAPDRLDENGRDRNSRVNAMRAKARWKHRRRLLNGRKPAKGKNPRSAVGSAHENAHESNQVALSAVGSGTPRGKENATAHDPRADDEPIDAVWRGRSSH